MVIRAEGGLDSPGGSGSSRAASHASPMRNLSSASGGLYVSAPGKIILFGEHAVVYGRTAIAGSIDLRTYVSLFTSADGRIYLSLPDLGVEKTWMLKDLLRAGERLAAEYPVEDDQAPSLEVLVPIARKLSGSCEDQCGVQHLAILAFWYLLLGIAHRKSLESLKTVTLHREGTADGEKTPASGMKDLLAVKCTVRFKLPSCVGLGSSGAYCVCIATALLQTAGLIPPPSIPTDEDGSLTWEEKDLDMIRKWATSAESLIHGRASGLDAAVCTYGGVASYKPGTRIEHLKNLPELRVILVNSKVERNTSRMVATVKERLKKFPDVVEGIFTSIDAISRDAAKILHRADENGGDHESVKVSENGGCSEHDHHSLQANIPSIKMRWLSNEGGLSNDGEQNSLQPTRGGSVRSTSLASYVAGGKRGSSVSAISGVSDKGELVDTFTKLNDLCRINNQLLIALGVGHPKVDQICTTLARYGIHPKMTGAGGGGSVFAFLKPDTPPTLLEMISNELTKLGYEVWQPPLGGPGVVEHSRKPDLFHTSVTTASSSLSTPASKHK